MTYRIKTIFQTVALSFCFAIFVVAAAEPVAAQELPKSDGTGEAPDMMVDLFHLNLGPVAKRQERMMLSSLRGRVVLMDIFWSRCPHCEAHAPQIAQLYNQYRQRGFTVLGIATDQKEKADDVASLKKFVEKTRINYPVAYLTSEVRAYYADPKSASVPQVILFGADGKMVLREVGWDDAISAKVKKAIEAQLSKMQSAKSAPRKGSK